jgi:hypothetical protein
LYRLGSLKWFGTRLIWIGCTESYEVKGSQVSLFFCEQLVGKSNHSIRKLCRPAQNPDISSVVSYRRARVLARLRPVRHSVRVIWADRESSWQSRCESLHMSLQAANDTTRCEVPMQMGVMAKPFVGSGCLDQHWIIALPEQDHPIPHVLGHEASNTISLSELES